MAKRTLTIEILGDAKSGQAALKGVGKEVDTFSSKMEKVRDRLAVVGTALTALVTVPVIAFFNDATNKAASYADSINRLRVLTGPLADETIAWADSLLETHGIGKALATDMIGTFTSILTAQGLTTEAAIEQSKQWVRLSADAASFYDLPHKEVQDAITAGLRGEYEQLEKLNVFIKESDVQKRALIDTGKARVADLTDQEKATARVNLITEQLMRTEGDYARTADDVNNKTRQQQQALDDLQIEIGTKLIPIKQKLLELTQKLLDWFNNLSPAAQNLALIAVGLAAALGPVALGLSAVAQIILVALSPAVASLATALWALATNPVTLIIAALVVLAAGLYTVYQRSEEFRQKVDLLADILQVTLGAALSGVITIMRYLIDAVLLAAESFLTMAAAAAGWVTPLGQSLRAAREDVGATRVRINQELDAVTKKIDVFVAAHIEQAMEGINAVRRNAEALEARGYTVQINTNMPGGMRAGRGGRMGGGPTAEQHGGPVRANSPYIVGERRPELFVPNRAGRIIPSLAGMGGVINATFNIAMNGNANQGTVDNLKSQLERMLSQLHRELRKRQ